MYALVVDSSTAAVTAGLVELDDERVVLRAIRTTVDAKAHGELLAPGIHALLSEVGIRPHDLAAVVAGLGPGPFTGLRVGLVTAAALGQALQIPVYGVCSLDGLGYGQDGTVLVATDARRRELYWAVYRESVRVVGPSVGRPDSLPKEVQYAVGEGALRYAGQLGIPVREEPAYPSPLALAVLAADRIRAGKASEQLTPLYLRRPDAVVSAGRPSAAKSTLPGKPVRG